MRRGFHLIPSPASLVHSPRRALNKHTTWPGHVDRLRTTIRHVDVVLNSFILRALKHTRGQYTLRIRVVSSTLRKHFETRARAFRAHLLQRPEPFAMQRGLMHEDLLRAIIRDYKPKPFANIEPFHLLSRARVVSPRAPKFIQHNHPPLPRVRRARASPRLAARTTARTNSLRIYPPPLTRLPDVARARTSPPDRVFARPRAIRDFSSPAPRIQLAHRIARVSRVSPDARPRTFPVLFIASSRRRRRPSRSAGATASASDAAPRHRGRRARRRDAGKMRGSGCLGCTWLKP